MDGLDRKANDEPGADNKALQRVKDRIAKESAKGAATRNQQAVWDRILETRILLQKSLTASQQLPRLQELQAVKTHSSGCSARLEALSKVALDIYCNSLLAHVAWIRIGVPKQKYSTILHVSAFFMCFLCKILAASGQGCCQPVKSRH